MTETSQQRMLMVEYDWNLDLFWSYLPVHVHHCGNIYYIFGQVHYVNICRCQLFGHVHQFRSYSFGHLDSVKWITLLCHSLQWYHCLLMLLPATVDLNFLTDLLTDYRLPSPWKGITSMYYNTYNLVPCEVSCTKFFFVYFS